MASSWNSVPLSDVTKRITKGTTPTTGGGAFSQDGIAFVKVESITADGRIDASRLARIDIATDARLSRSRLERDDILFTIAGTIGRVSMVDDATIPGNTNQAVAIVRPDQDIVEPRFLYFALRDTSRIREAQTRVVQSVQANFSLGELSRLEVPLPSRSEQREIALILGALDDKIELNRKTSTTQEAIARALFASWFVDFEPVRLHDTLRYIELHSDILSWFPRRLDDDGKPEGWFRLRLRDVAEVLSGGTPSKSKAEYWGGNIPWITPKVMNGVHAFDSDEKVTAEAIGHGTRMVQHGSVLVMVRGMGLHRGVRIAQARRNVTFNQDVKSLVAKNIAPVHLLFAMLYASDYLFAKVEASGHGTGVIPTSVLDGLTFVTPDPRSANYRQLMGAFDSLNERMADCAEESKTLATLRDALLPKLISGELQVTDAERVLEESA
jgi:type I restriction enzyme S subunit